MKGTQINGDYFLYNLLRDRKRVKEKEEDQIGE
jgi:hypothetical protein